MCGIAGIFYRDGHNVSPKLLQAMTASISHRGPDGTGVWLDDGVGFGHRRLAIRELTDYGAQPMLSSDNSIVVLFNGEIYNDKALKAELARDFGFFSRSSSDTEVIPAGYQAWGKGLFHRLEGMFAIALWDRKKQELVLARDGIGIKPLYYSLDEQVLRFGSEIKALLADPDQKRTISPADLSNFLTSGYPSPDSSLLQNIKQVPPGHIMVIGKHAVEKMQFWQPTRNPAIIDEKQALERLQELFSEVVRDQLVSDVPVAILQSGGIDSSLISLSLPKDLNADLFCVSFNEASHDETAEAQLIADKAGRRLNIIRAENHDAEAVFRSMVHHSDGQLADSSAFPTWLLCQAISRHARVALSGDGGDEFFAGYPTYAATYLANFLAPMLPNFVWEKIGYSIRKLAGVSDQRVPAIEKVARFLLGMASPTPHTEWRRYMQPREARKLLTPEMLGLENSYTTPYAHAYLTANGTMFDKGLLADQRFYLPGDLLMKSDRMSMAHGLELRVPFLDRRIMDFAGSLDRKIIYSLTGKGKFLLRRMLAAKDAPEAVSKRAKTGFNIPVNVLLRQDLHKLAQYYFEANPDIYAPYLRPSGVRELWREHQAGIINHNYLLWTLLVFGVWRDMATI